APFSSMGPTVERRLKPEVVAHGVGVTSNCIAGRADGITCPAGDPAAYTAASGTSMAAPAGTGAGSLMYPRAAPPGIALNPHIVRALLAHTATDLDVHPAGAFIGHVNDALGNFANWNAFGGGADGPDYMTGYGLVNANAAVNKLNAGNSIGGE